MIQQFPAGTMLLAKYPTEVRVLLKEDSWTEQGDYLCVKLRAGLTVAKGVAIIPLVVQVHGEIVSYYGVLVDPNSELGHVLATLGHQEQCTIRCWGIGMHLEHEVSVSVGASLRLAIESAIAFDPPTPSAWWEGVRGWREQYLDLEEVWLELEPETVAE